MDKNNEQKNNKTPEMKPKQDSFRPWLKPVSYTHLDVYKRQEDDCEIYL